VTDCHLIITSRLVGLILSFIGYKSAKDNNSPTTMGMAGMILSGIAIIIAIAWGAFIAKAGNNISEPLDIENCDQVLVEMEKVANDMKSLEDKGEDAGIGDLSKIMNATSRMARIQVTAGEMECNADSTFRAKMAEIEGRIK